MGTRLRADPNDDGTGDINNGPDGDPDMDNVTNLEEFERGLLPNDDDTDDDLLKDGVETNNGEDSYISATDTGTDPLNPDTDGDGINDGAEDNGRLYMSELRPAAIRPSQTLTQTPCPMAMR